MSNYNLVRGEELFFKEIDILCAQNPTLSERLRILCSNFSGKVGVMQEGNLNTITFIDEEEGLFELNAVPSFKKLAHSCLFTLKNSELASNKELLEFVINSYKTKPVFSEKENKVVHSKEISEQKIKENEEIENISKLYENLSEEIMYEDLDGKLTTKLINVDNIDLIDDFEDEDLTVEGMRTTGMIDTDFDTTSSSTVNKNKNRNLLPLGKLEIGSDGSPTIYCPFTGSTNVYQIDSSTYASFETDEPFRIVFNLADFKPE